MDKGIRLIEDRPGRGIPARDGSSVVFNARFFLRRGEEVTRDSRLIAMCRESLTIRRIHGVELIDHTARLGDRRTIACVEKALYGMQEGGYREILASPHLCYGNKGVKGLVPPGARLRVRIWVHAVTAAT